MIEQLPDYNAKCNVPGSQGKHYGDNSKCTDGYLPLVEHVTNGKKDYRKEMPKLKARKLHYDDMFLVAS